MGSVTELAEAVDGRDPVAALAAVAALRRLLEELEAAHVTSARLQGSSWEAIAAALGVKRQTAHRKHAHRILDGGR
ncbi:helix-turn-helix domain-containing protein [Streptosporangium subroseum]|uniref:helix-turn-helix domain-containing protein n=1 Tax=Streptosporangium subroseum TaxID=106412 RepID=UPI0030863DE4|nr:helix-turn-helix domain-containing protein [Streptosporangium subroseum]